MSLSIAISLVALGLTAWALHFALRLQKSTGLLAEQVRELNDRLATTEDEVTRAALSTNITESLLIEKGVADEDEIEEARRQLRGQETGLDYERERDGELH